MQAFLHKVVEYIRAQHSSDLSNSCIVVPNRRTVLFLKNYFAANIKKAEILPDFFTIDEFAEKLSTYTSVDNLTLLNDLYKAYKLQLQKEAAGVYYFDDFIAWGHMLLSDFGDIDASLVNPDSIFSYLSEAKAIENWNVSNNTLTDFQKNYLKFYNSLAGIYKDFTESIKRKGYAYQSHILRTIADDEKFLTKAGEKWNYFFFVGFNALSKAEEKICNYFIKRDKGKLIFDYDLFYVNNQHAEAGYFIRKSLSQFGNSPFHKQNNYFLETSKVIRIVGIPKQIGQAKMAGLLLKSIKSDSDISNTALVLCNEDLLFPMLNSIPDNIANINVTMGYPMHKTVMADFYNLIINLYENAQRISKLRGTNQFKLNIKDFLKIISNPYFKSFIKSDDLSIDLLIKSLRKQNKIYYTNNELIEVISRYKKTDSFVWEILLLISTHNNNNSKLLTQLLKSILSLLLETMKSSSDKYVHHSIEYEFMFHFHKLLNRLTDFFEEAESSSVYSLRNLIQLLLKNNSVPFSGEPLKGLQLMGLLESRNLDFDNLIMLSVNEGILPKSKNNNSFIPMDIRRHFNIPVYSENESIYAYHFYRLLQRAKHITLFYNTENDINSSGEKSRFISQICNELPIINSNIIITEEVISTSVLHDNMDGHINIPKTDAVLVLLKEKAKNGLSPTSVSTYLQCPIRFYFRYLLDIKTDDEPEDNFDMGVFGSVIHDMLETIFNPIVGKKLTETDLKISTKNIEDGLKKIFTDKVQFTEIETGKNHLMFKIAIKYVSNFLKSEAVNASSHEIIIKELEQFLKKEISIIIDENEEVEIKLLGKIDRIDSFDRQLRILDYKTGSILKKDIELKDWDDLQNYEEVSPKVLQLLFYAFLYFDISQSKNSITTGFISLRNHQNSFSGLVLPDGKLEYDEDSHVKTGEFLQGVFKDMFNKGTEIEQTKEINNCKYCDYKKICNR
ncbi:MAG: PD-(D/E)XK nuclease family protein [Bacteroidales bacterium]|nr:PD-(D/E)XK nuclease family protein [Bacteroidales bacterium]